MSTPNKRKHITIDTKVEIINAVEKKKSNAEICRQFDIPSSTLYTILKDKKKILDAHTSGAFAGDRKKIRHPDYNKVDEALVLFFKQARRQSIPISGPQLLEKGKEIAESLGLNNFAMS
ncbi:tigger transposable element-derived protein 4 [Elysia marginata]|uniref:Tigger transposable element-derived protein 4 n=1 Tax=Elysia marginata TaxID=1093978 RepID=A0AAV4H9J4_9GAST|nr:tigger transposable element-derived protein 4 [Elysia marginata]